MKMSLRDIARLAEVSPATVSRVFTGRTPVAEDTRQRVLDIAAAHGFRPSAIGQVAFGGGTQSIGVLVPNLSTSFFADIAQGLQLELLQADYLPMILQEETGDPERRAIGRLLDHRVDGMVLHLVDEALQPHDFSLVLKVGIPVVLLGVISPALVFDVVCNDDRQGGRQVGEHLVGLGHRRLGFCYFGAGHSAADTRLAGFREVLDRTGIALREQDIAKLDPFAPDRDALFQADMLRVLRNPDRPTAIFASTDLLARTVYLVAREVGLRIPQDLSVVGFANLNFAALTDPPLTTVDQHGIELGRRAARLIMARLKDPSMPRRSEVVPTQLVVRASTAAPPGAAG
jgi:LacI family transcriptional regulator